MSLTICHSDTTFLKTKRDCVWCLFNRKSLITIRIWFNLFRFRIYFAVFIFSLLREIEIQNSEKSTEKAPKVWLTPICLNAHKEIDFCFLRNSSKKSRFFWSKMLHNIMKRMKNKFFHFLFLRYGRSNF